MKIDTKKIGLFLKSIEPIEFIYLKSIMGFVENLNKLIKDNDLSKEYVCKIFSIPKGKYIDFTKGNYNYSMDDMSRLNAAWFDLEVRKLEKKVPIKVG